MNIGLYRVFFSSQQSEILPKRKDISMYNIVDTTLISYLQQLNRNIPVYKDFQYFCLILFNNTADFLGFRL